MLPLLDPISNPSYRKCVFVAQPMCVHVAIIIYLSICLSVLSSAFLPIKQEFKLMLPTLVQWFILASLCLFVTFFSVHKKFGFTYLTFIYLLCSTLKVLSEFFSCETPIYRLQCSCLIVTSPNTVIHSYLGHLSLSLSFCSTPLMRLYHIFINQIFFSTVYIPFQPKILQHPDWVVGWFVSACIEVRSL